MPKTKKPTKSLNLVGFITFCISTGGERGTAYNTNALNQLHFDYCKYINKYKTLRGFHKNSFIQLIALKCN